MSFKPPPCANSKYWRINGSLLWKAWMQAIHEEQACKFGYKLWVAATPLGYAIQFYPYMGKDNFFDPDLGPREFVVDKLTNSLPKHAGSNY